LSGLGAGLPPPELFQRREVFRGSTAKEEGALHRRPAARSDAWAHPGSRNYATGRRRLVCLWPGWVSLGPMPGLVSKAPVDHATFRTRVLQGALEEITPPETGGDRRPGGSAESYYREFPQVGTQGGEPSGLRPREDRRAVLRRKRAATEGSWPWAGKPVRAGLWVRPRGRRAAASVQIPSARGIVAPVSGIGPADQSRFWGAPPTQPFASRRSRGGGPPEPLDRTLGGQGPTTFP